jgi:hypothetical protein
LARHFACQESVPALAQLRMSQDLRYRLPRMTLG